MKCFPDRHKMAKQESLIGEMFYINLPETTCTTKKTSVKVPLKVETEGCFTTRLHQKNLLDPKYSKTVIF